MTALGTEDLPAVFHLGNHDPISGRKLMYGVLGNVVAVMESVRLTKWTKREGRSHDSMIVLKEASHLAVSLQGLEIPPWEMIEPTTSMKENVIVPPSLIWRVSNPPLRPKRGRTHPRICVLHLVVSVNLQGKIHSAVTQM